MTTANDQQRAQALLSEIEAMGAKVKRGRPADDAIIAKAEAALGFALPASYREFLRTFGSIEIELVRTWFFYGVPEKKQVKKAYVEEFKEALEDEDEDEDGDDEDGDDEDGDDEDEDEDGGYFPRRFIVLADEGDYANAAEGFVWDADLEHIRFTAGMDWIERSENRGSDYWAFLIKQLEQIRDRIADPNDELDSMRADEVNARRKLAK